ncbi:hypothetical protein [Streptomyces sp. NPDC046870]|uniref:wHTH domain-containing protein n=1 Tax=Streptomyces sp. NPDC046870 TaxID=3155135 RepID=UPI003452A8B7
MDACRDPFETFTKSVGDGSAWSKGATGYEGYDDPERPRYAHAYACARYATPGFGFAVQASAEGHASEADEKTGFPYFTRALTEIARDTDAPGSLDALEPLLEPWLDTGREVPWCHVVRAAHDQRTTTEETVARLTGYGCRTASQPPAGTWTRDDEPTLLRGATQHEPAAWLPSDRPVTLTHVLHAAQVLARTPAEVPGRLRQLGHRLPGDVEFTDPATP